MSEKYIPSELTFDGSPFPDSSNIVNRFENVVHSSPESSYSPDSNNQIIFTLTGDNFVDLSSLEMYSSLTTAITSAGSNTVHGLQGVLGTVGTRIGVASTYELFSNMQISTLSGKIIEDLPAANLYGRWAQRSTMANSRLNTTETFSNSLEDVLLNDSCQTATNYQIAALKLLGFLHSGVYVQPSFVGGLRITLTLAPNSQLYQVRNAADSAALTMSQVKLHYKSNQMSPEYLSGYYQRYSQIPYIIRFTSYSHFSGSMANGASYQMPFNDYSNRAKSMVSIIRPSADITDKTKYSQAFFSPVANAFSYRVNING
jgi:hypothetical protein